MKNNQNIKVRSAYKAVALATLLGIAAGCKSYRHDNVVLDIQKTTRPNMVLVRDLQDGTERVVLFDDGYRQHHDVSQLLQIGDTVTIIVGGIYSDSLYLKNRVLDRSEIGFEQKRSCFERARFEQNIAEFDSLKRQMQKTK